MWSTSHSSSYSKHMQSLILNFVTATHFILHVYLHLHMHRIHLQNAHHYHMSEMCWLFCFRLFAFNCLDCLVCTCVRVSVECDVIVTVTCIISDVLSCMKTRLLFQLCDFNAHLILETPASTIILVALLVSADDMLRAAVAQH
jgi:hypothetical protein